MTDAYKSAKENYIKGLKDNSNEIRRLRKKLQKEIEEDSDVVAANQKIEETKKTINSFKRNFAMECVDSGIFSKVYFYNEEFQDSKFMDALQSVGFNQSLFFFLCSDDKLKNLGYKDCVEIINSKANENIRVFEYRFGEGSLDLFQVLNREINKSLDLLENEMKYFINRYEVYSKRLDFWNKFKGLKFISKNIKSSLTSIGLNIKNKKESFDTLTELLDIVENARINFYEIPELLNPEKNNNQHMISVYENILKSWESAKKTAEERALAQSDTAKRIAKLQDKSTKNEILKQSFNDSVIQELAEDPRFLIGLGEVKDEKSTDPRVNKIAAHLISEFGADNSEFSL